MVQRAVRLPPATPLELPPFGEDFDDGPDAADQTAAADEPEIGEPPVARNAIQRRSSVTEGAPRVYRQAETRPTGLKPIPLPTPTPLKPAAPAEGRSSRKEVEKRNSKAPETADWPCGPNEGGEDSSARLREQLEALRTERRSKSPPPATQRSLSAPTLERGAAEPTAPDWLIRDIEKPAERARRSGLRPILIGLAALIFAGGGAAAALYVKGALTGRVVASAAVSPATRAAASAAAPSASAPAIKVATAAAIPAANAPAGNTAAGIAPAANGAVANPPVAVVRTTPANGSKAVANPAPAPSPNGVAPFAAVDAKPRGRGVDEPNDLSTSPPIPNQGAAGTRSFRTVETSPRTVTTVPVTQPANGIANTATLATPVAAATTQAVPPTQSVPTARITASLVPTDPPRPSTEDAPANKAPNLIRTGTSAKPLSRAVTPPKQRTGPRAQVAASAAPANAAPVTVATAAPQPTASTGVIFDVVSFFKGNSAATGTAVATSDVRVHAGPASKSASIGVLKAGTPVPAAAGCTGWCQVTVNGKTGWVYHTFLK